MKKINKLEKNFLFSSTLSHLYSAFLLIAAPFWGDLLLSTTDPTLKLLVVYCSAFTSFLTQPFSIILTSYLLKHQHLEKLLILIASGFLTSILLLGVTIFYQDSSKSISLIAFLLSRLLQSLCTQSDLSFMRVLFMEAKNKTECYNIGRFYEMTTMLGILVASFFKTFIEQPSTCLRSFWILMMFSTLLFILHRYFICHKKSFDSSFHDRYEPFTRPSWMLHFKKVIHISTKEYRTIFLLTLILGISHFTYLIPFIILPQFFQLHYGASFDHMDFFLLIFDFFLIWHLPRYLSVYSASILIKGSLGILIILFSSLPFLQNNPVEMKINLFKILLILFGVLFLIPQLYIQKKITASIEIRDEKYIVLNGARTLSQFFFAKGTPFLAMSFYHLFGSITPIFIYVSFISVFCYLYLSRSIKQQELPAEL